MPPALLTDLEGHAIDTADQSVAATLDAVLAGVSSGFFASRKMWPALDSALRWELISSRGGGVSLSNAVAQGVAFVAYAVLPRARLPGQFRYFIIATSL